MCLLASVASRRREERGRDARARGHTVVLVSSRNAAQGHHLSRHRPFANVVHYYRTQAISIQRIMMFSNSAPPPISLQCLYHHMVLSSL